VLKAFSRLQRPSHRLPARRHPPQATCSFPCVRH
jgi:hypothetical protein